MISGEDLEAFAPDLEVADRIVERAKAGVPRGRHIMANEEMPLIKAYVLMRSQMEDAAKFMAALKAREESGMAAHEKE